MTSNFEMVIDGADAQDLFFVEKAVSDTKVVERGSQAGTTSFGMPGVVEAVILMATSGAVSVALAWVVKNRKDCRIKIRRRAEANGALSEEIDVRLSESESSDKAIEKVEKWLSGSAGVAAMTI